ncbi:MAG: hypothetical protein WDN69_00350 [Aliidongia sp.]
MHRAEELVGHTWHAQAEIVRITSRRELAARHQVVVERPEGAAARDPDVSRAETVAQSRERRDFVAAAIGLAVD